MKLLCPNCGVKGSADDSYSGRKVRCPKCGTVFEAKSELALDEVIMAESVSSPLPESALVAEMPVGDDLGVAAAVERDLDETVTVTATGLVAEEASLEPVAFPDDGDDLSELVAEIDGQLSVDELGMDGVDVAAMDSDSGDTILESTALEEAVIEDPQSEEIAEEMDDTVVDREEIAIELSDEPDEEESLAEEAAALLPARGVEDQPYGVGGEQCWQCGRQDTEGEPFIARDGRLYCTDCVSLDEEAAAEEAAPEIVQGEDGYSAETMIAGTAVAGAAVAAAQEIAGDPESNGIPVTDVPDFTVTGAIKEAWRKIKGVKGAIWGGSACMYLVLLASIALVSFLMPSLMSGEAGIAGFIVSGLVQAVTDIFSVLFIAGLLYMGIRKVAGQSVSWKMVFRGFSSGGKIIVTTILQAILISIGFLLLILPGIYLMVGYSMALPLIMDQDMSPWEAMETSRKAVHKVWWKVFGIFLLMVIIFVVSIIPLGIGLIWAWPMFIVLVGVVYHYLFRGKHG